MDRIAYHPLRVTPPTSLFLPYTDQEVQLYQDRSANPLFNPTAQSDNTYRAQQNVEPRRSQTMNSQSQLTGSESKSEHPPQQSSRSLPPSHISNLIISEEPQRATRLNPTFPPGPTPSISPSAHHHASQAINHSQRPINSDGPESRPTPRHIPHRENNQIMPTHRSPPYYSTPSPLIIEGPPKSCTSPKWAEASPIHPSSRIGSVRAPSGSKQPSPDRMDTITDNKRRRSLDPRDQPLVDGGQSISEAVAEHYNSRPNQGKDERVESPIFGLRKFNNWIKSVIIGKFAHKDSYTIQNIPNRLNVRGVKVLELGCGKGGDLAKWQKAGVEELFGFDIAAVSIDQARQRYQETSRKKYFAKLTALDCFSVDITTVLQPHELERPFDVVSLQFCMHYAFETEEKARMMLRNVSTHLIKGGVFIGTIPNPDLLIDRLDRMGGEGNLWGNPVYEIKFPSLQPRPLYGFKYLFYLRDAVEHVPEYIVFWDPFVQLAAEHGLKLIYKEKFHEIFEQERHKPNNRQLLNRMDVINSAGQCLMSEDQWDATGQEFFFFSFLLSFELFLVLTLSSISLFLIFFLKLICFNRYLYCICIYQTMKRMLIKKIIQNVVHFFKFL
ncbi:mRNA capping enzyme-domain-containing protein [Melampsora americana]|nr:mRNA capping enzyme-domain-containing protein [Melampsora americana]